MRVHFNVLCAVTIVNLTAEVLHNSYRAMVLADLHNWEEEVAMFLALQGWAQSDHDFEIIT